MSIDLFGDSTFLLLIAANVSILCILLLARVKKLQKALLTLQAQLQQETGKLSRNQHALIKRLGLLEKQLEGKRSSPMVNPGMSVTSGPVAPNNASNVSQASKLLNLGVDAQQLAQGLGLSQAEAKLMSLVHEQQSGEIAAA